jgi:hypothetical protein
VLHPIAQKIPPRPIQSGAHCAGGPERDHGIPLLTRLRPGQDDKFPFRDRGQSGVADELFDSHDAPSKQLVCAVQRLIHERPQTVWRPLECHLAFVGQRVEPHRLIGGRLGVWRGFDEWFNVSHGSHSLTAKP